jgi:hypothetical protein
MRYPKFNSIIMKIPLFALLLLAASLQQEILSASGSAGAVVSSNVQGNFSQLPSSSPSSNAPLQSTSTTAFIRYLPTPTQPQSWNFLSQNTLGGSERWQSPGGENKLYPLGWLTTYIISFSSDCTKNPLVLQLAATGSFFVYLNDKIVRSWGAPYPSTI